MNNILKRISLSAKSLRREMVMAFGLIVLAFIVFSAYLFPGVSSFFESKSNLHFVFLILIVILILGGVIVVQIVEPLIRIAKEAKKMAEGDLDHQIRFARNDEIGELGVALNRMSQRIKENLKELNEFSQKTEAINSEINKRIVTLSNLAQVSHLVSQNAKLEDIVKISLEKCLTNEEISFSGLILLDSAKEAYTFYATLNREGWEAIDKNRFIIQRGQGLLGLALESQEGILIDKNTRRSKEYKDLTRQLSLNNIIVAPVISRKESRGLLVIGNDSPDFAFSSIEKELVDILAKQLSIAIENEILAKKLEKLEIVDHLTGLFNSTYMYQRLNEEIQRAIRFQRPCAFAVFSLNAFKEYQKQFGHLAAENVLIKIADIIKEEISEVDKAGRLGEYDFAVILPEKNKRQAIEIAEKIKKKIDITFSEEEDKDKRLVCIGAITENPLDGVIADDLITKAKEILLSAKGQKEAKIYHS